VTEARKIRALLLKQELLCLRVQGYVIRDGKQMDRAAWRKQFLRDLTYRMRDKSRPFNAGSNAGRAADILRNGDKSRWAFAANSTAHAGDDKRGIKWHLAKYRRKLAA
jgi:hypothetical protein